MTALTPQQWHERAVSAEHTSGTQAAREIINEGLRAFPDEPALWNSAANIAMHTSDFIQAAKEFAKASELAPSNLDFPINQSIALSRQSQHSDALEILKSIENRGKTSARYCSMRGTAEKAMGNLGEAATWYDLAIQLDRSSAKALHGRARVSLERAESDAVTRFDQAIAANSSDPELWLGKAQALDAAGNHTEARQIAEQITAQIPTWLDGLRFLAQLRLAANEQDFTSHYGDTQPEVVLAHCDILSMHDRFTEAAEVAARARKNFSDIARFGLEEAVNASAAGDEARADKIFAALELPTTERYVHEARHRIRTKELNLADDLLNCASEEQPWNITVWALRDVVWRLQEDRRADWLHGQDGLAKLMPLDGSSAVLNDVVAFLSTLHDTSPFPLGQSLRGGTQTRGNLFDRMEEPVRNLREAISRTIASYQSQLPAEDITHPLLRHRNAALSINGSWSVRLSGKGDHHTAHIHSQGTISSALYLQLPPSEDDLQAGWLEIGRPAPDLKTGLPPLKIFQPKPGHLALFPSTLYHGTRPFASGTRMTVAFDVTAPKG